MYRIYCLCSSDNKDPDLKMYWNKRLQEWTFNNPSIVTYITAYTFITNKYLTKEYIEYNNPYNSISYYLYGLEEV